MSIRFSEAAPISDRRKIHARFILAAGPQVMASLRNLTISMLRMAGANNIAKSLRACGWNRDLALRCLGIVIL